MPKYAAGSPCHTLVIDLLSTPWMAMPAQKSWASKPVHSTTTSAYTHEIHTRHIQNGQHRQAQKHKHLHRRQINAVHTHHDEQTRPQHRQAHNIHTKRHSQLCKPTTSRQCLHQRAPYDTALSL